MQVGSQLGEEWRNMSEWDKAPYNEKASLSKANYDSQMESYRATSTFVPEIILTKKKKTKDPDAPKRPVSAFLEYVRLEPLSFSLFAVDWTCLCITYLSRFLPRTTEQGSAAGYHWRQPLHQVDAGRQAAG
jgi:hypothetical protein